MSFLYQSKQLILMQFLTINYEMEISDQQISNLLRIDINYLPQLIYKVRRLLPVGAIERVPEYGYVYRSRYEIR